MDLHRRRGQSIVLFALTLLLLVLMVTMTIGFGVKAKEKMEMQYLADAAAYSNAVATARALNGVAILNRAEVAVMVTLAATQSNISFASTYMGTLNAIQTWSGIAAAAAGACCISLVCPTAAACCAAEGPIITTGTNASNKYNQLYNQVYQSGQADHQAGLQARSIQGAATNVHQRQREIYFSNYNDFVVGQKLTQAIVTEASQGHRWMSEYKVDTAAQQVSLDEIKTKSAPPTAGAEPGDGQYFALSPRNTSRELGVKAAMGTRGEAFVRDRGGGPLTAKLLADRIPSLPGVITVNTNGSGHWTAQTGGPPHPGPSPAPYSSSADDEGSITGQVPLASLCPASIVYGSVDSWVYSTDLPDEDDAHHWTGQDNHAGGDKTYHTMGDCTACPGVWTMFIDLNPQIVGAGPTDSVVQQYLWGQPKNFAVIRRDTNERCGSGTYTDHCGADPWNLMFKFQFTPTGEDFDNRGLKLSNGQNVSNQIVLASGITYYHRPGHWKEPPNFFNPFWRGTLSSVAVDEQGDPERGSDVVQSISRTGAPSAGTARQVVTQLKGKGYKGW